MFLHLSMRRVNSVSLINTSSTHPTFEYSFNVVAEVQSGSKMARSECPGRRGSICRRWIMFPSLVHRLLFLGCLLRKGISHCSDLGRQPGFADLLPRELLNAVGSPVAPAQVRTKISNRAKILRRPSMPLLEIWQCHIAHLLYIPVTSTGHWSVVLSSQSRNTLWTPSSRH